MRDIKTLTDQEAKEFLDKIFQDEKVYFEEVSFERKIEEDGKEQVTWSGQSLIGIKYRNDNGDGCMIFFEDLRFVKWAHEKGFDITPLIKNFDWIQKDINEMDSFIIDVGFYLLRYADENDDPKKYLDAIQKSLNKYYK